LCGVKTTISKKSRGPYLVVAGWRLDGDSPSFVSKNPTSTRFADGTTAMLAGVDIPTTGSWDITTRYRGHTLTFVVAVDP
jgi:hypothetical protein